MRERPDVKAKKDVSTVISMLPYPVDEKKPGLNPGIFRMKSARKDDIELMTVERCVHPVYLDETRPRLIVPDPSDMVAESIVLDHKRSIHGYVPGEAEPGIDWVPGEFHNNQEGKIALVKEYGDLLKDMRRLQLDWFKALVSFADDDWAKWHMHKFITKLQRRAAEELNLQREWLLDVEVEMSMSRCKYCFTTVHPLAVICPSCRMVLNEVEYKKGISADSARPAPQVALANVRGVNNV